MGKHVYIDESGDLGRSLHASRFVIITTIATEHPRKVDKAVRKIWQTKQHKKYAGELHAIDATNSTRSKLLSLLDEIDVQITFTLIDKVETSENLHDEYYRAMAKEIAKHPGSEVYIVDKRDTDRKRVAQLAKLGLTEMFASVEFANSQAVKQLQAVDFVSWSLFQAIENDNSEFIDIIRRRITDDLEN